MSSAENEKCIDNVASENLKGRDPSGHLLLYRNIILKRILKKQGVNWIHLDQDRARCRAVAITVMSLRVS
jgi:hypothetical protein